jgi:hypothetical protein
MPEEVYSLGGMVDSSQSGKRRTRKKTAKKSSKAAKSSKAKSGRGSPEAIEKRRVARAFNAIFAATPDTPKGLDGRTEKRRQRLVEELKTGKSRKGQPLLPVERLQAMHQLLEIGETKASLTKQGVKFPRSVAPELKGQEDLIKQFQAAYDLHPDSWKILGVSKLP